MDTFLQELKAKRAGDLNAILVTLNDGPLCREVLSLWIGKEWVTVAPHSPLLALPGPSFTRDLTLPEFCGAEPEAEPEREGEAAEVPPLSAPENDRKDEEPHDDDS